MENPKHQDEAKSEAALAAPTGSTFSFEFQGRVSRLRTGGDVAFDRERKQWRATIIAQRDPELRFDAWDDGPAIASLMVCAKWMGRDMSNEKAQ